MSMEEKISVLTPQQLSEYCRQAKTKAGQMALQKQLQDRAPLYAALEDELPKSRKNAARLLGALGEVRDVPALIRQLEQEKTRFVRPSLILALGALGGEAARRAVQALPLPVASSPEEEKHVAEERQAIQTALSRLAPQKPHPFVKPDKPLEVELRAPRGFLEQLQEELIHLGYTPFHPKGNSLRVMTTEIEGLYRARCFTEMLIPLSGACPPDAGEVARRCGSNAYGLLRRLHAGEPPFRFRLEWKLDGDRKRCAQDFVKALGNIKLANSPSGYEAEIRVERRNRAAAVYLKLFTVADPRFTYRTRTVPAAIHPATAAALCRLVGSYQTQKHPRVYDPCCGGGTLLIERGKSAPCKTLTGTDIAKEAVDIAWEGAKNANSNAKFLHMDCLRFVAEETYDEVLCNLPFGNRVGSHDNNERLYAELLQKLSQWLRPGGIALLYTMEYALLTRLVAQNDQFSALKRLRTEAGGLTPWVFLLQKKL